MLTTRISLACEGRGCKKKWNFDGLVWTRPAIRRMAHGQGWRRINLRDLCPDCAAPLVRKEGD